METAVINSLGQVTIPPEMLKKLGLSEGGFVTIQNKSDKIILEVKNIEIKPKKSVIKDKEAHYKAVMEIVGSIKSPFDRPLTQEEEEEAIDFHEFTDYENDETHQNAISKIIGAFKHKGKPAAYENEINEASAKSSVKRYLQAIEND